MIELPEIKGLTVIAIQQAVTAYYGVTMFELLSIRREQALVEARSVAMWLSRRYTALSYPQIARLFGNRDHTTIMAACDRVDRTIRQKSDTREAVVQVTAGLAAAMKRDALAHRHRIDVDPLQSAVDHLNSGTAASLPPIESRQLLLLISYAMAAGDVRDVEHPEVIEAENPPAPVPTALPTVNTSAMNLLMSRAQAVIGRRADVEANLYSKFEKSSREAFEAALDALETTVNLLTGKPAK